MLKFYKCKVETYYNKEFKGSNVCFCLTENEMQSFTESLTWENLSEKYSHNGSQYFFNIWNRKKGRQVEFFDWGYTSIKEWKEELNIKIQYTYTEFTPSIDFILKWHDGDKAIQYLKERGLSIN